MCWSFFVANFFGKSLDGLVWGWYDIKVVFLITPAFPKGQQKKLLTLSENVGMI
jgi:hypothetical protein